MRRGGGRSGRRSGRVCGGGWGAGGGARQSAGARPRRPPRQDSRRYAAHGGAARRRNDVRSGVRRALFLPSAPLPLCPPPSHASPAGSRGVERVDAVVRRSLVCAPIGSRAARCVHRLRLARSAQAEPCLQAGSGVAGRTRPLSTWPAGKRQGACHETRGLRPGGGVGRGEGADAERKAAGAPASALHAFPMASFVAPHDEGLPAGFWGWGHGKTVRYRTVPCVARRFTRVCFPCSMLRCLGAPATWPKRASSSSRVCCAASRQGPAPRQATSCRGGARC